MWFRKNAIKWSLANIKISLIGFINSLDFEHWCAASQWSINSLPSNHTSSPKSQRKKKQTNERQSQQWNKNEANILQTVNSHSCNHITEKIMRDQPQSQTATIKEKVTQNSSHFLHCHTNQYFCQCSQAQFHYNINIRWQHITNIINRLRQWMEHHTLQHCMQQQQQVLLKY